MQSSGDNWWNHIYDEYGEGEWEMEKAETSEFGGFVYCTECYAVVGETDECLCLLTDIVPTPKTIIGCGQEGGCCGG